MPPKAKRKRASLKLDSMSGQIKAETPEEPVSEEQQEPAVRHVVEVVGDAGIPEAIETIKKDAEEIEDAVESIEEHETEVHEHAPQEETHEAVAVSEYTPAESAGGVGEGNVESLFVKPASADVNPEITVVGKRGPSLAVWVGAMLGVALAIGVSLIVLVRGPSTLPFLAAKPTPTPAPTAVPTPTPDVSLKKSDIKVRVVNGGGTPGAGSKMKAFLEGKGYTVVSVGNAKEYTYTQTEVAVKKGKDDVSKLLTEDLKADYSLSTVSGTAVDAAAAYDAEVIVGKE